MTRQNRKHKYVREAEQNRKRFVRGFDRELGKRAPRYLRKWWAAQDRWILVEENDDDSREAD